MPRAATPYFPVESRLPASWLTRLRDALQGRGGSSAASKAPARLLVQVRRGRRASDCPVPARSCVLLVEEEPSLAEALRIVLRSPHFFLQVVILRELAVPTAETTQPDLILLDAVGGEPEGWDTLSELREREATREIPVLM